MRNTVFFIVLACLLAGCNGKGPAIKLESEVDVSSEEGLPVKIMSQNQEPLPVKMVPDEIPSWVVVVFLAVAIVIPGAAFGSAIAAWRAAYNTRKVLGKIS